MSEKGYYVLAMSLGIDFDDAFRLYEDLKDKDYQTMIDTLCREGRIVITKIEERLADCASRLRAMWGEDWAGVLELMANHPEEALEIFDEDMIHESNNILDEISKIKMGEKE